MDDTPAADDFWVIPIHGIDTGGSLPPKLVPPLRETHAVAISFDDDLPTDDYQPRLRRSA